MDADYELERLGWNGKTVDPLTGWSDHGARWHGTRFARWLSVDPPLKGPGGLVEHGLAATPYGFVVGNPVLFWDPDGYDPVSTGAAFVIPAHLAGLGGAAATSTAFGTGAVSPLAIPAIALGLAVYHYGEGALFGHEPVPTRNPNQGDKYEADVRDTPFYSEPGPPEPGPVDDGPSTDFQNAIGDRGWYDGRLVTDIDSSGD